MSRFVSLYRTAYLIFALLLLTFSVAAFAQNSTSTSIVASSGTPTLGAPVTFTVTVSDGGGPNPVGTNPLAGNVILYDGPSSSGVFVGVAPTDGGTTTATATLKTAALAVATHSVVAVFVPAVSANFSISPDSPAPASVTVGTRTTSTVLGAPSPDPVGVSATTDFTVTISDTSVGIPGGTPGSFTSTTQNPGKLVGHASALLPNGTILIVGGEDNAGTALNTGQAYDPSNGHFNSLGSFLSTPRVGLTATALGDGTVLITGGSSDGTVPNALDTAEIYDPVAGTTSPTSNNMSAARMNHTATLLADGKVLIIGGQNQPGSSPATLSSVDLYDPSTKTFSALTAISVARFGHTATLLPDNTILVAGGSDSSYEIYTYSAGSGTPGPLNSWTTAPAGHTATLLPDGNVLIAGGVVSGSVSSALQLYSFVGGAMMPIVATLDTARTGHTANLLPDGTLLFTAGSATTLPAGALNSAKIYVPAYDPQGTAKTNSDDVTDTTNNCTLAPNGDGSSKCTASLIPGDVGTGTHNISEDYLGDSAHDPVSGAATTSVTVVKGTPVVSWAPPSPISYGTDLTGVLNAQVSPSNLQGNGTFNYSLDPAGTQPVTTSTILPPGSYTLYVIFVPNDTTNYNNSAQVSVPLTVNKAHLTVTADNQSKSYDGSPFSAFTATISGFVNGETESGLRGSGDLSGNPTYSGSATTATNAGSYTITPAIGTLAATNYDFPSGNFVAGTLTINKVNLTVTADNQSKSYDGSVFTAFTATLTGFVNGETDAGLRGSGALSGNAVYSGAATTAINVGSYPITPVIGTLAATNYDFPPANFVNGTLLINAVHLTVTADNQTKTYNGLLFTAFTSTLTGFVNGETDAGLRGTGALSGNAVYSGAATTAINAGTYTNGIVPAVGTLSATNYDFPPANFLPGTLTVNQAHLTVTADPQSKIYDAQVFTGFTSTLSGFVNGETDAGLRGTGALSGSASYSGAATTAVNAGTYSNGIVPSAGTLAATNYDFPPADFVTSTLVIQPRNATWTTNPNTKVYGENDPAGLTTGTGSNFIPADNVTATYTRDPGENVSSSYHITANLAATGLLANYSITNAGESFSITKRAIGVQVNSGQGKIYGDNDPTLTFTALPISGNPASGLANNPGIGVVDSEATAFTGSIIRATGQNVGSYAITQNSLSPSGNYDLQQFAGNNFGITPRSITITADASQQKFYGQPDPLLTFTVGGMGLATANTQSGQPDTPALVFNGQSLVRVTGENVASGGYAIGQGSVAANANYGITIYTGNTFTILPAITEATPERAIAATVVGVNGAYQITAYVTYNTDPVSSSGNGGLCVLSSACTPAGTIAFKEGSNTLDTKPLGAGTSSSSYLVGLATSKNLVLSPGTHTITLVYNPGGNFVTATLQNLVITVVTPPSAAVVASQLQTTVATGAKFTVAGVTTVTTDQFMCVVISSVSATVPPTCSIANGTPSGNSVTANVVVVTQVGSGNAGVHNPIHPKLREWIEVYGFGVPAIVFIGLGPFVRRRFRKAARRRAISWIGVLLILTLLLAIVSCGGGSFNNSGDSGPVLSAGTTSPGSYTAVVYYEPTGCSTTTCGQALGSVDFTVQ